MKYAVIICRILLGAGFVFFGSNILHPFLPMPQPVAGSLTAQFMAVMGPTHWMTLIGAFQFLGGLLVLLGGTAPMGLVLLAPILVNILAFHAFVEHGTGIGPGLVLSALEVFLIFAYGKHFRPLLTLHARYD